MTTSSNSKLPYHLPGVYYNTEAQALPKSEGKRQLRLDIAEVFKPKSDFVVQDRMNHFYVAMDNQYILSENEAVVAKWRKIAVKVDQTFVDGVTTYRYAVLNLRSLAQRLHLTKEEIAELKLAERMGTADVFIKEKLEMIAKDQKKILGVLNKSIDKFAIQEGNPVGVYYGRALPLTDNMGKKMWRYQLYSDDIHHRYSLALTSNFVYKERPIPRNNREVPLKIPEGWVLVSVNSLKRLGFTESRIFDLENFKSLQTLDIGENLQTEGWEQTALDIELSGRIQEIDRNKGILHKKFSILLENGCNAENLRISDKKNWEDGDDVFDLLLKDEKFKEKSIQFVNNFFNFKKTNLSWLEILKDLSEQIGELCLLAKEIISNASLKEPLAFRLTILIAVFLAAEKKIGIGKLAVILNWIKIIQPTLKNLKKDNTDFNVYENTSINFIEGSLRSIMDWERINGELFESKCQKQEKILKNKVRAKTASLEEQFILALIDDPEFIKNTGSVFRPIMKDDGFFKISLIEKFNVKNVFKLIPKSIVGKYKSLNGAAVPKLVYSAMLMIAADNQKTPRFSFNTLISWFRQMSQLNGKIPVKQDFSECIFKIDQVIDELNNV